MSGTSDRYNYVVTAMPYRESSIPQQSFANKKVGDIILQETKVDEFF